MIINLENYFEKIFRVEAIILKQLFVSNITSKSKLI